MREHKELRPEDICAAIDTREVLPLDLSLPSKRIKLDTADYSVCGLTHLIAVERKSIDDLLMCAGRERERFERCIQRMLGYETRVLVVEASWADLERGEWRSTLNPSQVIGSVCGWIAQGIPVVMAGNREAAARYVSRILFVAARRRWRELQAFHPHLKIATIEKGA